MRITAFLIASLLLSISKEYYGKYAPEEGEYSLTVNSSGGLFKMPDSVVFDIPANAFPATTTLTYQLSSRGEINKLLFFKWLSNKRQFEIGRLSSIPSFEYITGIRISAPHPNKPIRVILPAMFLNDMTPLHYEVGSGSLVAAPTKIKVTEIYKQSQLDSVLNMKQIENIEPIFNLPNRLI